ncbi:DUF6438 domain-containing protein [Halopiger xanaduensis]|uniref:DUF6438 domain-containing protein n=1 Tax=Halopiger xanaduensis (strain DSM 18323 / JCM 14033 / SH-6) TaxID=797210 RepID=F8DBL6_HALXS|nr:hypothetical protein [Halopiger xanaduensis]AEH38283.1 hypothetical protein Halxa_3675 [Halopiger xanaduensis SH-6]
MVISIQQYNDEQRATEELGRIHNGEILTANVDGFDDVVDRMRTEVRQERRRERKYDERRRESLSYRTRTVLHRPPPSLKDELSMVGRYDPPYGKFAVVRPPKADRERLLEMDREERVSLPDEPRSLDDIEFRLYHGPFDDSQPVYLLCITADGYGFYEGRENTPLGGPYAFRVSKSKRHELLDLCLESGFFEFDHTFVSAEDVAPLPSVSTGVRVGESEKWVYNYSRSAPRAVQRIETAIQEACLVDQWLEPDWRAILETLTTAPEAAGPALALLAAAHDERVLADADPDAVFEAVRPYLSSPDRTTRRDATETATRIFMLADCSLGEARELFEPLLDDDDEEIRTYAADALELIECND